jgi:hypothetical protein
LGTSNLAGAKPHNPGAFESHRDARLNIVAVQAQAVDLAALRDGQAATRIGGCSAAAPAALATAPFVSQ